MNADPFIFPQLRVFFYCSSSFHCVCLWQFKSNYMASHSSSQEIVPSQSRSTSATRSARLRSLFSSRCNCFNCCSAQSTASTTITHAFQEIAPSASALTYDPIPENEDSNVSEQAAPCTSTFTCNTQHTNAFEGIAPSASTMPERKLPYDVFINHRGPDVKHTLAASLYKTLTVMGLRVFLDREELELGDFLPAEIQDAMRTASLHIAIFSQNYAQSPWCLAELAFMLKTGTQIVPVFYHIEPDVVRYAKGFYAEAFSQHEEKGRYTLEKLRDWKNALRNVSYNFGDIIRNEDDEGRLLKSVVNRVLKEMKNVPFEVAKHPIGLDEAVKDFETTTLQHAVSQSTVRIVGIWGMGGSGKTTLAKQIYNNKYTSMDKSSFLLDVRDAASRSRLHKKQKKLLKDLGLREVSIENIEEGKRMLGSRLQSIRVLIILDDVDNVDQLDALVPKRDSLGCGSLIVATSRELEVLRSWGIQSIYRMKALDPSHAKQLFCWHAFLQPSPYEGFEDLVQSFLNVCDGLPLSLKVFGAQLYGIPNKDYWKTQLHKISRILPKDIKERLKVSFDALDDEEKQIFLDIACLFIGENINAAIAAWDGSRWNGLHSWERLSNKCLVEPNGNLIRMHDHLRDLGREIANHQLPYRLWSPEQIINVDHKGVATGYASEIEEFPQCSNDGKLIVNTNRGPRSLEPSSLGLKFLYLEGNSYNQVIGDLSKELIWLRWHGVTQKNLFSLSSLKNLRVLELSGYYEKPNLTELWKTDENAPMQLRQLVMSNCTGFRGFPKSIRCLRHLKKIVVRNGNKMKNLPEEFCFLESLEHLEIHGPELSSLPRGFGHLRSLRHLQLHDCWKLKSLPVSFKELTLLQSIYLGVSHNLKLESDILENMTRIEFLTIRNCTLSEELSRNITTQASLTVLSCRLREVPVNIGQLNKLRRFQIAGTLVTSLPATLGDLSFLTSLEIFNCPKLESLPDSLGCLNLLRNLSIESSGVKSLPKSVGQLINLHSLEIRWCPLGELGLRVGLFDCLKRICLRETQMSKVSISCPNLQELSLDYNRRLTGIENLPNTLERLYLLGSPELDALPSFSQACFLREFKMKGCYGVKKIHGLEHCTALEELTAHTRWEEAGIESLERMEKLRRVELQAFNKSGVASCIHSMKKWPKEEVIVCTRAAPDAATLLKSFTFSNLSVVDSFAQRKITSDPSLKWPSTAPCCILLCFVVNYESKETSLRLAVSEENTQRKRIIGNYHPMEVEKDKWVWTAFFTQHSSFLNYISSNTQSRIHICDRRAGEVKKGEVEGVIVTGEEERVWKAFTQLWSSLSN